jgi:hypothetical protein
LSLIMSAAYHLAEEAPPRAGETGDPQVFSRIFSVPPGAPWEQGRAARLEVRHGSPLPVAELMWRLRRLGSWRLREPGRYVVFYIRAREYARPFETTLDVDGAPMRVAFGAAADGLKRMRRTALTTLGVVGCVAVVTVGVVLALQARADAASRLEGLERSLAAKARLADRAQLERRQAAELRNAAGRAIRIQQVLDDLRWATATKAPEARILALHWDHGLLAIEARGEAPPIQGPDRQIERSSKPVRAGVWLWGVKGSASEMADPRP